jgi:iron complex transport system ATP-binding protein
MSTAPPLLVARGVSVGIDGRTLCAALDLDIRPGEMLAVIGRNGIGKSTVLSTLAGLRAPLAGTLKLDGMPIGSMAPRALARRRALLPQSHEDAFASTVLDTVLVGRHPHIGRWSDDSAHDVQVAFDAMARVSLTGFEARDVRTLSGGERQRVAIAALLAQDAPLCLLDEPVTHLDLDYQMDTLSLFAGMAHDEGRAVVAVLHDLNQVLRFCDRVLLLTGGGEWVCGAVDAVLQPDTLSRAFCHPLRELRDGARRYFVPA